MPNNLLSAVQQNLGLSELKRVNPVTYEVPHNHDAITQRLDQACLTAVFAGIFNLSRSEKGIDILINGNRDEYWPQYIFGEKAKEVVERIVQYANCNQAAVIATLDLVSADAVALILNRIGENNRRDQLKTLVANQRIHILPYLPPALNLGEMLKDNTLDDVTNKMEGPVSSFMHKMELAFAAKQTEEDAELHRKLGNI